MQTFHIVVLVSAIVILVVSLYFISKLTNSAYSSASWPPNVPNCPDWWVASGDGKNQKCINQKNLGTCSANEGEEHQIMDFNISKFTGGDGLCNKYKWANNCNVSWDGITYGVKNPCL